MKPEELRANNLIIRKSGRWWQKWIWGKGKISQYDFSAIAKYPDWVYLESYEGIPINMKSLKYLSKKTNRVVSYDEIFNKYFIEGRYFDISIRINEDNIHYYLECNMPSLGVTTTGPPLEFIHQLQNLYYALNLEEL